MLRAFGRRMLGFLKGYLEILWHGDFIGACGVVPVNGESAVEGTGPVDGYGVQFLEGLDEVVGVFLADVLDPKVVNDEGENDGLGGILPERRSSGNRGESKMGKMSFEPVVGDAAGLFEAGHAFSDIEVNQAVRIECREVVLVDYFVRDAGQCEFHVIVAGHGGAIVEILDIHGHESGTGNGDGYVE